MTTLPFWKLHGLGNDFIFFDAMPAQDGARPQDGANSTVDLTPTEVAALCDRHTGIGADGIIVVKLSPRDECAAYMHYINADGTLAQMCGNGVRCFAKFLVDHGYVAADAGKFVADTLAGPKPISFTLGADGLLATATVNMGAPILEPSLVPTKLAPNAKTPEGSPFVARQKIASPWGPFAFTCVSMGNPHAVCFLDPAAFAALPQDCFTSTERSLDTFDVARVGAFFEAHEAFPEKTNVEFAVVESPDADGTGNISMRVFERGCGETHACGTGACATQVAANLLELTDASAQVHLLGGTLHIELAATDEDSSSETTNSGPRTVIMTGPARESFTGSLPLGTGSILSPN
ncbi:diaminopimelate epimerase [Anaerotardibacter muris]|uniref:diaminopimelate epimerase n=1 Tax=Anaerotardibacter muris TaxID=2941505 RepID=UPI00203BFFC9|nr:diaminopimelate epimerase [Anaerotardibacter muris]